MITRHIPKDTWETWIHDYFLKGKTFAVYLLILMIPISIYELFTARTEIIPFILGLALVMTSYGVFTDLVAHLWWSGFKSDVSEKGFWKKVLSGRTHDVYGMWIYLIALVALLWETGMNQFIFYTLFACAFGVMGEMFITRFYH